jgi:uncharacterized damage-inducible protein DinB
MLVSAETLRIHLNYTAWAATRLLDAAAQLSSEELQRDFGTADKSVVGTLAHVFAADRVWICRVRVDAPAKFLTDEERDLSLLQREWPAVLRSWQEWVADLTDENVTQVVSYYDSKGNAWTTPCWKIVLHVVNHGTHHRGQVSGFLRAMGHKPPPLDLIAYYRELG